MSAYFKLILSVVTASIFKKIIIRLCCTNGIYTFDFIRGTCGCLYFQIMNGSSSDLTASILDIDLFMS